MKKIGGTYFQVREHIFNRKIHVFLNIDDKGLTDWAKHRKIKGSFAFGKDNGFCCSMIHDRHCTEWAIALKEFQWRLHDMNTLVHEIHHAVVQIFDEHGCPHSTQTQEFFAQSEGNLFEAIGKALKERGLV